MRPYFTIHAGEYLVGSFIEQHYPKLSVWVPSKDTGIDLLVTDAGNKRTVSLQVKFSKDFNPTNNKLLVQSKLSAVGWWGHDEKKIKSSKADFWVLVLPSFTEHQTHYIIIPPKELHRRLHAIHGKQVKKIHSYLWVTKKGQCWETRGLNNADQEMLAFGKCRHQSRDFTQFLDNWSEIEKRLKNK